MRHARITMSGSAEGIQLHRDDFICVGIWHRYGVSLDPTDAEIDAALDKEGGA